MDNSKRPAQDQKVDKRKKFFDINDYDSLVKTIRGIPNISKIQLGLSQQQSDAIGGGENLLVMGHSGTGKTACALMRLYAIEILFKKNKAMQQHRGESKFQFQSRHFSIYGIKNFFLCVSSRLAVDAKKKFEKLRRHAMKELDMQQVRRKLTVIQKFQGKNRIKDEQQLQKQPQQDYSLEGREDKYNNFRDLKLSDYPGFFSIEQFLIMLDGSLRNNFFIRSKDGKRQYEQIKSKKKLYRIRLNGKEELFASQCDWEDFRRFFSNHLNKKAIFRQDNLQRVPITAINVWTEITSIIKGSYQSHFGEKNCLTLQQYLERSRHYSLLEKNIIYNVFLNYQKWKQSSTPKYYDLLDLANHILGSMRMQGLGNYKKAFNSILEFHNLVFQDIQDCPPSVSYLISLFFGDSLYLTGDPTQVIRKETNFSFEVFNEMFHQNFILQTVHFNSPKRYFLTEQFRTRCQILNLANSVIQIMKYLFPSILDTFKKQFSQKSGPHPIYLKYPEVSQKTIIEIIGPQKTIKQQIAVAIIGRNTDQMKKLPPGLKQLPYEKLTISEAKGLQFDDLILFNIFDPSLKKIWRVIEGFHMFDKEERQFEVDIYGHEQVLCQLRMLYMVIMRAKGTIIFYQESLPEQIEAFWQLHNLISTMKDVKNVKKGRNKYLKREDEKREKSNEEIGYYYYKKQNYCKALDYYQREEGLESVCLKIEAIISHQEAEEALIESKKKEANKTKIIISQNVFEQLRQYNRKQSQLQVEWLFKQAADKYENIQEYLNAGYCYYQAKQYESVIDCLKRVDYEDGYQYMALSCQKTQRFDQAASYFIKCKNYQHAFLNYQKCGNYSNILEVLKHWGDFHKYQRQIRKILADIIEEQIKLQTIYQKERQIIEHDNYYEDEDEFENYCYSDYDDYYYIQPFHSNYQTNQILEEVLQCIRLEDEIKQLSENVNR